MKNIGTALLVLAVIIGIGFIGCGKKDPQPNAPVKTGSGDFKADLEASMQKAVDYLAAQFDPESGACIIELQGHKGPSGAMTSLAVMALIRSGNQDAEVQETITKGAEFLAGLAKDDGSIVFSLHEGPSTYATAVAIMVLNAVDKEKYKDKIKKAQGYLVGIQVKDENDKAQFGGIAYAPGERDEKTANLSTTAFALEALATSGYKNDEATKRALTFLNRCQNNSETNDMEWAGNDGGSVYSPQESKAGEIKEGDKIVSYGSYGSMTFQLVKSFIYADIKKDDPRITKALAWISNNYTLEANPGMTNDQQGLYYYFHTMAKTLSILELDELEDSAGIKHDWRQELGKKLMSLQNADGSWKNPEPRWYEDIPALASSYAVIALANCQK